MRRSLIFIFFTASVCVNRAYAAPTPEEVLKTKGLTKVGAFYLLDGDIKSAEKLRLMRAAKFRVDDNAAKRMKLEKDIENAKATHLQLGRELTELGAAMSAARKSAPAKFNEMVPQYNSLISQQEQIRHYIEARDKELSKLSDPTDDYIKSVMDVSTAMEAVVKKYEALAADEEVKASLAAINQRGGLKLRLGPSAQFNNELPQVRKLRDMMRETVIKLVIEGGTPHANVVINESTNLLMTVDTGAAWVTLTGDAAKKLGLKTDANRSMKTVAADGKVTEGKIVMLSSVRVGQFTIENVEAFVFPSNVAGSNLLGGTFLRNFVTRVDLGARELHMTQVAGVAGTGGLGDNLTALEKYEQSMQQAKEIYWRTVLDAKKELLKDLNSGVKGSKPEDAAKLEKAKKEAEEDLGLSKPDSGDQQSGDKPR
jgi:clan AA aspartic protease (TIGR02281 family)